MKNTDNHICLLGWLQDDDKGESAIVNKLEIDRLKWIPKIELQGTCAFSYEIITIIIIIIIIIIFYTFIIYKRRNLCNGTKLPKSSPLLFGKPTSKDHVLYFGSYSKFCLCYWPSGQHILK
jgi:hypothetical protein